MLIFIRHGSTQWTPDRLHEGELDLQLNPQGIQEIQDTAKKLAPLLQNKIILAITSPLQRTLHSTKLLNDSLNFDSIQTNQSLRARNYCNHKLTSPHIQKLLQEKNYLELEKHLPPEAETTTQFNTRVQNAIQTILNQSQQYDYTIIISHAEVFKSLTQLYLNKELPINKGQAYIINIASPHRAPPTSIVPLSN